MFAAELKPGLVLSGRFRLLRPLGRGGTAEVWVAGDETDNSTVTVKFCTGELAVREAGICRQLVHPHIAPVTGLFGGDEGTYLVRGFVDGESIGRLRNADLLTVLGALRGIADALRHAHSVGIVHRDLKPSNVLCDANGFCWLTDFGAACAVGDAGGAQAAAGSLPFMSPQQLDDTPASPSDDVYGFGALLYDLLTGEPPFHPDVSPERIRNEVPVLPTHTIVGEPLPTSLTRLLGALLAKTPQRRPPGMAAVAEALEEIRTELAGSLDGPGLIRPHTPTTSTDAPGAGPTRPAIQPIRPGTGVSARTVYVLFAVLLLAGISFIVLLPKFVPHPPPAMPAGRPGASLPGAVAVASGVVPTGSAKDVEGVLGELLQLQDELKKTAPGRWAPPEWAQFGAAVSAADAAYRSQDFATARTGYEQAVTIARALRARFPPALQEQLEAGAAALAAGDQPRALAAFDMATAMAPSSEPAHRGFVRAQRLDALLVAMAEAAAAERNGDHARALEHFRQAAALDALWPAATDGVRRLERGVADDAYRTAMSRGFTALAARDFPGAQSAFESVLKMRPGDAAGKAALDQLATERRIADLTTLREQALALEKQEQWPAAIQRYQEGLKIDPTGQPLLEGLARSQGRLNISMDLQRVLADMDQLNDDGVIRAARAALERGRAVPDAGPLLREQLDDAAKVIALAEIPVPVTFESDGVTDIVIYKVGQLGSFTSRTLSLKPGTYVAVGTRQGYRDVRRSFRVTGDAPPVVAVRCEEPI